MEKLILKDANVYLKKEKGGGQGVEGEGIKEKGKLTWSTQFGKLWIKQGSTGQFTLGSLSLLNDNEGNIESSIS